jgi:hypothetical protein
MQSQPEFCLILVATGLALSVAEPVERIQNRVVADGFSLVIGTGEHEFPVARKQLERPQDFDSLSGQWNYMRRVHLHTLCRNSPTCLVQIELCPRRFYFLARAHKRVRHEFQSKARDCVPL